MTNLFTVLQALPTATEPGQQLDFIELAFKGGIVMIPILLLSLIGVFIFTERFIAIHRANKIDQNFMNNIRDYISDNRIDAAVALCQSHSTPISRMIEKGLKRVGRPLADVQTAIENVGNIEVSTLEKGLPILAMVAGGAPMLGFLGTVTGMVSAFFDMAAAGSNLSIDTLSSGIYEALVTTVAGLIVGLIGYFGYNYLVARVSTVVHMMEANTVEFMDILYYQSERPTESKNKLIAEPKKPIRKKAIES
ncbi:biopolymer transporter ExbB [Bacteroidia bacterium]|nr:biopolymer transporter ExbB [Bacteroidia bacterium]